MYNYLLNDKGNAWQWFVHSGVASAQSAVMLFRRSAEGVRQLGGSGGMPPQKIFEF